MENDCICFDEFKTTTDRCHVCYMRFTREMTADERRYECQVHDTPNMLYPPKRPSKLCEECQAEGFTTSDREIFKNGDPYNPRCICHDGTIMMVRHCFICKTGHEAPMPFTTRIFACKDKNCNKKRQIAVCGPGTFVCDGCARQGFTGFCTNVYKNGEKVPKLCIPSK